MRQRMIKPEFFSSETLAECTHTARLLFVGLWVIADDAGNLKYSPRKIASQLFPYDGIAPEQVAQALAELEQIGCIKGYENGGEMYINIPNFLTFQTINRPSKTNIPAPGKDVENVGITNIITEHSLNTHGALTLKKERKKEEEYPNLRYSSSSNRYGGEGGTGADKAAPPSPGIEVFAEVDEIYSNMLEHRAEAERLKSEAVPCPQEVLAQIGGGA